MQKPAEPSSLSPALCGIPLMEVTAALEKEGTQEEGRYWVQCFSSSSRELLVWRTLAIVLGLSQAVLVLMMVLQLRLCSQCSQQEGQTGLAPTSSMKDTAEGNGTEWCPLNWVLHRGKCYYFSKEERNWNRSREDCREKDSDLLVIKDQEERDFIKNRKQNNHHWIGLHIPALGNSSKWVDGSSFINGTLFSVSTGMGRCVSVANGHYDSDSCNNVANWICQKKAGKGGKSLSAEGKC
uniref:Killer cell lectin-like receptor subfamily B member 1B allele C isoform X2 n=1 Tax=Geotrypetes seraphini TaxID=260995 RepID=A0A6P8PF70_GEOSA|nr:killer cell lectin-like receptor subfamily B member 1B allele C isoform X2 [Geotrypetes seraphini]